MHNPYLNPACTISYGLRAACVDGRSVAAVTNKKVLCMVKLELSPVRCTLAVAQH